MNYSEAVKIANEYDEDLQANDLRFRRSVLLMHEDGSVMMFDSAFLMQNEEYIFVFTEHHSFRVYDRDDLLCYREFTKEYREIEFL